MKILIADDDADLRALIGFTLSQSGYQVCTAEDGEAALRAFEAEAPDFLLLDVNMPERDGFTVCREIRKRSAVPIMMLTVRDQEDDVVAALESGADDYVQKPFSPRSLLARVRALARRAQPSDVTQLQFGALRLDIERNTLSIDDADVHLTPLELKALQLLMASAGRTVSVERLLKNLWGRATARERRTLKQLIYRLRHKLEKDPAMPDLLQTTPGAGYRLNGEVRRE